jgi:hypothetical protein
LGQPQVAGPRPAQQQIRTVQADLHQRHPVSFPLAYESAGRINHYPAAIELEAEIIQPSRGEGNPPGGLDGIEIDTAKVHYRPDFLQGW